MISESVNLSPEWLRDDSTIKFSIAFVSECVEI